MSPPLASVRGCWRFTAPISSPPRRSTASEDPTTFDITRDPNPHLGFGGQGTHYCIGGNLARMETSLIFNAIADLIPDISKLSEPKRLRSGLVHGITAMEVSYR